MATPRRNLRSAFLVAAAIALGAPEARAATLSWSADGIALGDSGTWDTTAANWSDDINGWVAWSSATPDDAVFGTTAGTVTLGEAVTAGAVTFQVDGYTLTGSTLTLLSAIDASAGSATINSAIVLSGTNTWTAGSGKTLTIGGNVDNAGYGLTIAGSGNTSLAGILSGTGGLTKTGNGTLTLSGANTYSGGTTLAAGTLNIGGAGALGSGTLTIGGGTIDNVSGGALTLTGNNAQSWTGDFTFAGTNSLNLGTGAVTLGANRQVTVTANTLTVGGAIGGAFSLTKAGNGTLTLSGANTYSGGTAVSAGTLKVASAAALSGATSVAAGATLQLAHVAAGANVLYANTLTGAGTIQLYQSGTASASSTQLTGTVSGFTGTIRVSNDGAGTSDKWYVNSSTNFANAAVVVDSGSQIFVVGATTLKSLQISGTGNNESRGAIRLTANLAVTNGTQLMGDTVIGGEATGATLSGAITSGAAGTQTLTLGTANSTTGGTISGAIGGGTGTIALTVANGNYTLSGANTYAGATAINGGTLTSSSALGTSAITVGSAGTLALTRSTAANSLANNIAGTGTVSFTGGASGELGLTGTNSFSGTLSVVSGKFAAAGAGALNGTPVLSVASGSTFSLGDAFNGGTATVSNLTGAGTINGTWGSTAGTRTLSVNSSADTTFSGAIADGTSSRLVALTKAGAGTLSLTGANTYTGATTISAGTLKFTGSGALSTSSAISIASGAVLEWGRDAAVANAISGAGTIRRSTTTGNASFSGANSGFTGSWDITSGYVGLSGDGVVGASTVGMTLNGGGIYFTATGNTLAATRTITLGASGGTLNGSTGSTNTFAAKFTGSGGLTKVSGETAILTNAANDFTGNITVTTGTLQIGGAGTLGTGSYAGAISNATTLTFGTSANQTLSGVISGAGALNQSGSGVLTLSAANTYSGTTTVSAGTLRYGIANALAAGAVTVSGGTLDIAGFSDTVGAVSLSAGSITGSGGTLTGTSYAVSNASGTTAISANLGGGTLTMSGAGTLNFSGGFSGATTITGGTLNHSGALSGSGAIALNGAFTYNFTGTTSGFSGNITNGTATGGTFTVGAAGNLTTTGTFAANYGRTVLVDGTLSTGVMTISSGSNALNLNGAGTVTVSGYASHNAATNLNFGMTGSFTDTGDFSLGTASSAGTDIRFNQNAGTVNLNTSSATGIQLAQTYKGSYYLTAGTLNATNATTNLSSAAGITGSLIISGGTANLYGVNASLNATATGVLTVSGGTLKLGAGGITNTSGGTATVSFGTATIGSLAGWSSVANLALTGTTTFDTTGGDITELGALTGTGGFTKSGTGTLTLLGGNTYTGAVTLGAGTLALGGVSTGVNTLTANGGTLLLLNAGGAGNSTLALTASSTVGFSSAGGYYYVGGLSAASAGTGYDLALQDNAASPAGITLSVGQGNASSSYAGALSGAGSLVKSGTGTLTLTGTNTYAGTTTVSAGTLAVATPGALSGYNSASRITIGAGATLAVSVGGSGWTSANLDTLRANLTLSSATTSALGIDTTAGNFTYASNITSGAITKLGTGTLTLSGTNTFTGGVTIAAGTVAATANNSLGAATGVVTLGTTASASTLQIAFNTTDAHPITVSSLGAGTVTLSGTVGASAANTEYSGAITLGRGVTLLANTVDRMTFSGKISGTGDIVIATPTQSGGRVTWTHASAAAANTFSGNITLQDGAQLQLGVATDTSNYAVPDTASIYFNSQTNAATVNFRLSGAGGANTVESVNALISNAVGAGRVALTEGATGTITVGAGGGTGVFSGVISQSSGKVLSIVKAGAGTQTLAGTNTYTGNTAIAGGTLQLDYSVLGSAPTSILNASNTLSFTGTGVLEVKGRSATTSSQLLGAITLSGGNATLLTTANSATALSLGFTTISRSAGATLLFSGNSGTAYIGTTQANANGIIGPWAFIQTGTNLADYAVSPTTNTAGSSNVTAYASYTALTTAGFTTNATTNFSLTLPAATSTTTMTGATTANVLKLTTGTGTGASTLALGANNMTVGGLLLQGTGAPTTGTVISGTGLLGAGTTSEFIVNNSSASTLYITSPLISTTATAGSLTKTGAGTVVINNGGLALFTGAVSVNQGELQGNISTGGTANGTPTVLAAGTYTPLGAGTITVGTGATLRFKSASTTNAYTYTNAINLRDATLISDDGVTTFSGAINSTGSSTIQTLYSSKNATFSGVISGSGFLTITPGANASQTGTISFTNAANTFSGYYTLTKNTLALGGAATSLGAAAGLTVNTGTTVTWDRASSTNIATNTGLVVDLRGTFNAAATYNGGYATITDNIPKLLLNGGSFSIGTSNGAAYFLLNGTVEAAQGTTSTLTINSSGNYTGGSVYSGALQGSGNLTLTRQTGGGQFRSLGFRGNTADYSGNITVSSSTTPGVYFFSGTGGWGKGMLTATGAGATVVLGDVVYNQSTSFTAGGTRTGTVTALGSVTIGASGALQLLNQASTDVVSAEIAGPVAINGGTLGLYGTYATPGSFIPQANAVWTIGGSAVSTISAPLSINYDGVTFNVGDSVAGSGVDLLVSGAVGGSKTLTKIGAGTMALASANTNSGGFNIAAGTINVGNAGATGNLGTGAVVIGSQASLQLSHTADTSYANAISGAGNITKVQSAAVETLSGNLGGFTGTVMVQAGTASVANVLALGSGSSLAASSVVALGQYGALRSSGGAGVGSVTLASGANLQLLAGTPTEATAFFTAAGTVAFASGAGIFIANTTAIDAGTYRVLNYGSGALTYAGSTDITGLGVSALATSRNTFSLSNDTTNKYLNLVVTGVAASLVWNGTAATWDSAQATADAWNNAGTAAPDVFYNFDNVTLDDSVVTSAQTIALTGTVTPGSITVSGAQDYTINGTGSFGGAANITKNGTGTLRLANTTANTLTGTITVNGGKLAVTSAYTMSNGGLILNAGSTFAADANKTVGKNLTVSGSVALGDATDAGTLTFTGASAFATGATLTSNVATSFTTGATTLGTSLTLAGAGASNFGSNIALAGNTALTVNDAGGATFGGVLSGAYSLTKSGAGKLTLSGVNTYTGGTTISAGTLQLGAGAAAGNLSATGTVSVASGATLAIFGNNTTYTFSSVLAGAGTVSLLGTGVASQSTYTISGANGSFTGAWNIGANARGGYATQAALGASSVPVTVASGGQAYLSGAVTYANNFTIAGAGWTEATSSPLGAIRYGGGTTTGTITLAGNATITAYTSTGTINGAIGESVVGSALTYGAAGLVTVGTLTINGTNTYTGGTSILGAVTVNANTSGAFGSGAVTVGGDNTKSSLLVLANGLSLTNALTLNANAGNASGVVQLSGASSATISGLVTLGAAAPATGNFFGIGTGTLSLLGGVTSTSGYTFGAGNYIVAGGLAGGGNITFGAGNLAVSGGINTTGAVTLGSGTTSVSGGISSGGNVALGTGTYTLSGGGTYPTLSLAGGTLRLAGANALGAATGGAAATFTLGSTSAATLDLNGYSQSNAVLLATTSGLTITNASATAASIKVANTGVSPIAFNFTGNLALELAGLGSKNLTGANTYTGGTIVSAGSLDVTSLAAINYGDLALAGGNFSVTTGASSTLSGALSGSGSFDKNGAGTVTLGGGASGFTGLLNVNAGGLLVSGSTLGGATGASGAVTVGASGAASLSGGFATARDITILSGSTLRAGTGLTAGTLALNGGTLEMGRADLGAGKSYLNVLIGDTASDTITLTGGALKLLGDVDVTFLNGGFGSGTYTILTYDLAAANEFTGNLSIVGTYGHTAITDLVNDTVAGKFNVTVSKASMIWTGAVDGNVDGTTANFNKSTDGLADTLLAGDELLFNDTAAVSVRSVTLAASIPALGKVTFDTAGTYTVAGAGGFSGTTAQLVKTGSGTLVLGGVSTFGGGVHVDGGTLQVAADAALGDGAGSVNLGAGTTFQASSSFTLAATRVVNLEGNANIGVDSGATLSFAGAISGANRLTKTGNGTLALSGANTYSGGTTLAAGTLQLGANNTLLSTGALALEGGTLALGTTSQTVGAVTASAGTLSGTGTLTASSLAVTGSLAGTGTVNAASYSFSDGATFGSGLTLGGAAALAKSTAGTLTIAANLANTGGVSVSNGILVLTGTNSFSGGVSVSGGVLTLTGANTYTGGTTLTSGTIRAGSNTALAAGTLALNGGRLSSDSTAARTLANAITVGGTATLGDATNNGDLTLSGTVNLGGASRTLAVDSAVTISGVISNGTGLTKTGNGTLTLSVANTYTGTTTVSAGTLKVGNKNALGAFVAGRPVTQVVVNSGATLDFNGVIDSTYGYTIAGSGVGGVGALTNSGSAIGNGQAQATNILLAANASIGGTGNWALLASGYGATSLDLAGYTLTKVGANTIYLCNATATAGSIRVSGGTLSQTGNNNVLTGVAFTLDDVAGAGLALGDRNMAIGSLAGGGATGGNIALASYTLTTGALNTDTTYAGVLSGTGGLTKQGTGTLTLAGANTHSGATNVNAGSIVVGNANALASSSVTLGGGSLGFASALAGQTVTLGSLAAASSGASDIALQVGAGSAFNLSAGANNASTTYAGVLSGAGSLTKAGTGTMTLSGANTYAGGTTLAGGTLAVATLGSLGGGTLTYSGAAAAGLTINDASAVTLSQNIALVNPASAVNFTIYKTSNATPALGALTISGNITGGGANTTLFLNTSAADANTTFRLTGNNTFQGTLRMNRGSLIVGAASELGASGNTLYIDTYANLTDGALRFVNSMTLGQNVVLSYATVGVNTDVNDVTLTGAVSGAQTLQKMGSGSLTLTGAGSSTGGLNITAGTVTLAGGANRLGASAATLTIGSASATGKLVLGDATTGGVSQAFTGLTSSGLGGSIVGAGSTNSTLTVANSTAFTYAGLLGGTGTNENNLALAKSGSGDLTLSGANTYAGGTTLSGGTLRVANSDSAFGTGSLAVTGTATLATASGGGARTLANNINVSSGLTLSLDSGYANLRLNGTVSAAGASLTSASAGGSVLLGGAVTATNLNVNGSATVEVVEGANVNISAGTVSMTSTTGLNVLKVSGGQLSAAYLNIGNSTNNYGIVNQTGGTVTMASGGSGFRIGHWNNGSATVGSSYNISGGTLDATALSANATGSSKVINVGWDGYGTMSVGGGAGQALVKAYGFQLDANGNSTTYNDTLTVSTNGTVEIGAGGIAAASTADSLILSGGTLRGTASSTWAAAGALTASTTTTLEANSGATVTFSGALTGSGSLTTAGNGVVALTSGSGNTLTGSVQANAGTLNINGELRSISGLTIGSGATANFNYNNPFSIGHNNAVAIGITVNGGTAAFASGTEMRLGNVNLNGGTLTFSRGLASWDVLLANVASGAATITVGGSSASAMNGTGGLHLGGVQNFAVANATGDDAADLVVSAQLGDSGVYVGGTGGINKTGAGTMSLTNAGNSFTGAITVGAGTLEVGGGGRLNSGSYAGAITNNGALVFSSTANQTLSGVITGSGSLTKSGNGTLTLSNGSNNFSGGTTVAGGALNIDTAGALGSANAAVNGGRLNLNVAGAAGSSTFAVGAAGTVGLGYALTGDSTFSNAFTGLGTIDLATSGAYTLTLSGLSGFGGSVKLSTGTFDAAASGWTGNIIFAGGALAGGLSNYGGAVTVSGNLSAASGLPANVTLAAGGTIDFSGASGNALSTTIQFAGGSLSNASGFTGNINVVGTNVTVAAGSLGGGTLVLGAGTSVNVTGAVGNAVTVTGGSITGGQNLTGAISVNSGTFKVGAAAGQVGIDQLSSSATLGVAGGTLDLNDTATTNTINFSSGSLANAAAFDGTLNILSSANLTNAAGSTLGGTIVVNGSGTLKNNGTLTGSVTVETGGTLQGSGTFAGATVQTGGILSPGNSPGEQIYTKSLVLQGGAVWLQQVYNWTADGTLPTGDAYGNHVGARAYDTITFSSDSSDPLGGGTPVLDLSDAAKIIDGELVLNPITLRLMTLALWSQDFGSRPIDGNMKFDRDAFGDWIPKDFVIATYSGNALIGDANNIADLFTFDVSGFYNATGPRSKTSDFAILEITNQTTGLTQLTLRVVPEPSTYGVILGGLALAAAAIRRRRRSA